MSETRLVFEARISHSNRCDCFLGHRSVSGDVGSETRNGVRGAVKHGRSEGGSGVRRGRNTSLHSSVPRETEETAVIGVAERTASSLASSRNGGFGRAGNSFDIARVATARSLAFSSLFLLLHCGNTKRTVFEISRMIG